MALFEKSGEIFASTRTDGEDSFMNVIFLNYDGFVTCTVISLSPLLVVGVLLFPMKRGWRRRWHRRASERINASDLNRPIAKIAGLIETPSERLLLFRIAVPILLFDVEILISIFNVMFVYVVENRHGITDGLFGVSLQNFDFRDAYNVNIVIRNVVLVGFNLYN